MDNFNTLFTVLVYLLPTLVVGGVAYYFFKTHTSHLIQLKYNEDLKDLRKESLPIRIQAFERLTLFLERIHPAHLIHRINPTSEDKNAYERLLVATIEQEFEHNLVQQIYVSSKTWEAIRASKNATISMIHQVNMSAEITSAQKLREAILTELLEKTSPSETGLEFLKSEVRRIW
ncbi:MAG: hypothetical protein L0J45_01895 [Psychroflexus sp.]|nr:hypothetical protein [Psychroflexus sp.]MDN6310192.1 hypothetical protein [Psychroflexus sp.]